MNFLSIHSVSRSRFRTDGRSIVWRSPTFFARDSKKRFPPVGKRITKATAVVLFPIPGDSQCQSKRSRIEYTRSMEAQQRGSGVWTLRAVKVVAYFTSCLRNFLLVASFVRSRVPRPSHGIKFNACSQRINNSLIEQSRQSVRVRKLRTELKTLRNFFSNSESYIFRLPLFLFLPLLHRLIISCATLFVAIWRDSADPSDLEKSFGRFVDRSIVSSLLKKFVDFDAKVYCCNF